MGNYIDFVVTGDPAAARSSVETALLEQSFSLHWDTEWSLTAEKGSKSGNWLSGGLAKYLKLAAAVMSGPGGQVVVHLESESVGHYGGSSAWIGEAMGTNAMEGELASLKDTLQATFAAAGVLIDVRTG